MKQALKLQLIFVYFLVLFIAWCWVSGRVVVWHKADDQDYFDGHYIELSNEEERTFHSQDGDDSDDLMARYEAHFTDTTFRFPRQKVVEIRAFRRSIIPRVWTVNWLRETAIDDFLSLCNDTNSFSWGETTWSVSESDYFFRLYGADNRIVGDICFCLDDCHATSAKPFCPAMKFGGLSEIGLNKIKQFIDDANNWQ